MKTILIAIALLTANAHGQQPLPARDGNYCLEDIYLFFEQKFQSADKVKSTKRIPAITGSTWYYYVTTYFCSGYIVADMGYGDSSICTNAQYGKRTQTIERVYATGDCQAFLPNDEYPDLYN